MSFDLEPWLALALPEAGTDEPWVSGQIINENMIQIGMQFAKVYNVMTFNAVGDGTADDTDAIQGALDAAGGAGGGIVVIPALRFSIRASTRLHMQTGTTISAYGAYVFKAGVPTNGLLANFVSGVDTFAGYNGNNNTAVLGGVWDARGYNATVTYDVLDWNHCRGVLVKDVTVRNVSGDHAVEFNSTFGARAENVRCEGFFDPTSGGRTFSEAFQIDVAVSGSATIGAFDGTHSCNIDIIGCYAGPGIDGNGGGSFGKLVGSHTTAAGGSYDNIKVIGCTVDGGLDVGIGAYNWTNFQIANNKISGTASHGIRVTVPDPSVAGFSVLSYGGEIVNNTIDGTTSGAHGIEILGYTATAGVAEINVHGNIVRNAAGNGIFAELIYRGLSIESNNVYQSGSNGINLTGCQGVPKVRDNYVYHPASNYGIFAVQFATGPVMTTDADIAGNIVLLGTGATAGVKLSTGSSNCRVHDNTIRKDGGSQTGAMIFDVGAGNTYRFYENDAVGFGGDVAATFLHTSGTRVMAVPTGVNVGQNFF